jgi:SAM-dependent methyltransferase
MNHIVVPQYTQIGFFCYITRQLLFGRRGWVVWSFFLFFWLAATGCIRSEKNKGNASSNVPSILQPDTPAPAKPVSDFHADHEHGSDEIVSVVADYENKHRAVWQKPEIVVNQFGDLAGKTVADIGASTGYFTFRFLPKAEKVIGIEIDQQFINFMDSIKTKLPQLYRERFEARLATPDDPKLRDKEVDAVVAVNVYGYIENRIEYLKKVAKGMRPDSRLLIVDFKKKNIPVGPDMAFKVSTRQVEEELLAAGFTIEKIDNKSLEYQYIILASYQKKAQ